MEVVQEQGGITVLRRKVRKELRRRDEQLREQPQLHDGIIRPIAIEGCARGPVEALNGSVPRRHRIEQPEDGGQTHNPDQQRATRTSRAPEPLSYQPDASQAHQHQQPRGLRKVVSDVAEERSEVVHHADGGEDVDRKRGDARVLVLEVAGHDDGRRQEPKEARSTQGRGR